MKCNGENAQGKLKAEIGPQARKPLKPAILGKLQLPRGSA
jgi:hypothetical protein